MRLVQAAAHAGIVKDHKRLLVWQKATQLTDTVYLLIAKYPPSEDNALTDQTRRAAQSVEFNISEGCGRRGDAELARFLDIAAGSACELENCLDFSRRQNFGQEHLRTKATGLVIEVKKMLAAFLRRLRRR